MKKSKSFKKLLNYLEEQHKVEKEGYNEGVFVPVVLKIKRSEDGKSLLLNDKPIDSDENITYLYDIYDIGIDSITIFENNIPEDMLKITLPNTENQKDIDYFEDIEIDDDSSTDEEEDNEFNLDDIVFDDSSDLDSDEDYDNCEEINLDQLIEDIKSIIKDKTGAVSIVLSYNIYQYNNEISVVSPDGCKDRDIDYYGSNFIELLNNSIGLN